MGRARAAGVLFGPLAPVLLSMVSFLFVFVLVFVFVLLLLLRRLLRLLRLLLSLLRLLVSTRFAFLLAISCSPSGPPSSGVG
jgi:hypothetical protein